MTLQQFIQEHDGQKLETGGSSEALNQCVDLANGYIDEVLGLPKILGTNAKDFGQHASAALTWQEYVVGDIPETGDIVVWSTPPSGHIAVYIDGGRSAFRSFDQNWPIDSPCHIQSHSYNEVIGWLHPTGGDEMSQIEVDNINKNTDAARDQVFDRLNQLISGHIDPVANRLLDVEKIASDTRDKVTAIQGAPPPPTAPNTPQPEPDSVLSAFVKTVKSLWTKE